ncbi:aldo/keto reductase [Brevibacillus porteri]|uniref:aldo/keto reductase n=1 Tax=Brevibacillus porteri TaxID=2126350 RepID=UPI003D1C581B
MLSPLGLGCWQFSNGQGMVGKFWPVIGPHDVLKIVQTSLRGGINWFDTAEVYGKGQSEQMLAKALNDAGPLADSAHIATKWWPVLRTAKSMREADRVLREHGLRLISNQVKYSLLDRRIEQNEILDTAKELGIAIIAYSPLEQGILSGKFHKNPALVQSITGPRKWTSAFRSAGLKKSQPLITVLEELAHRYDASATQIALNWLIHAHGETVFAIPGASKVHHAEENVKAMRFSLTSSELQEIDAASKQVLAINK